MSVSANTWKLTVVVAHSHKWSETVVSDFRNGVSSLIKTVERQMRVEHPSLGLTAYPLSTGQKTHSHEAICTSCAFAILDVTDYDEDLALLAGIMVGGRTPFVFVCRGTSGDVTQRLGLGDSHVIPYESTAALCAENSPLHRELVQAISQTRVIEELVYELWFPRGTSAIWVVCPQIHEPGEFADRSSPDYTYLDNLGDTDALLEVMVFLSRYYPKAIIEKFNSDDLPRGHANNNLVVVGGPGSSDEISNRLCREMMGAVNSRVSYTEDCERMIVDPGLEQPIELRADTESATRPEDFKIRRDYGYFARFPNPLNENATVVLVNGIHTAGVLGAAMVFADRRESLRNYHSVFVSGENANSFECHFQVEVLNGTVKVPALLAQNIYTLGPKQLRAASAPEATQPKACTEKGSSVTIAFIAGDRGGGNRNQIQIPREFDSIQGALRSCKHRDVVSVATPILAATRQKLVEAYRYRPAILHFAGHGDDRSLSLLSDLGLLVSETPLLAAQLASVLLSFPDRIRLCLLNTCNSEAIARHLVTAHATDAAIGWQGKVADAEAIAFSGAFYARLGDGLTLEQSFTLASESVGSEKRPALFVDNGVDVNVAFV